MVGHHTALWARAPSHNDSEVAGLGDLWRGFLRLWGGGWRGWREHLTFPVSLFLSCRQLPGSHVSSGVSSPLRPWT